MHGQTHIKLGYLLTFYWRLPTVTLNCIKFIPYHSYIEVLIRLLWLMKYRVVQIWPGLICVYVCTNQSRSYLNHLVFSCLVVAEGRQFFTLMTPYVLSKCTQYLYTVCPSVMVLKTAGEQKSLIALFLGKMYLRNVSDSYWIDRLKPYG